MPPRIKVWKRTRTGKAVDPPVVVEGVAADDAKIGHIPGRRHTALAVGEEEYLFGVTNLRDVTAEAHYAVHHHEAQHPGIVQVTHPLLRPPPTTGCDRVPGLRLGVAGAGEVPVDRLALEARLNLLACPQNDRQSHVLPERGRKRCDDEVDAHVLPVLALVVRVLLPP